MSRPTEHSTARRAAGRSMLEVLFLLAIIVALVIVAMVIVKEMSQPSVPPYFPPLTRPQTAPTTEPAPTETPGPAAAPTTTPTTRLLSNDARILIARSHVTSMSTALAMFELDMGRFPTTEEGLPSLLKAPANAPHWRGPYLKELAQDPWERDYVYRSPGIRNPNHFDLYSRGPLGRNEDAIGNWQQRK